MGKKNYSNILFKRPFWLLMAVFCIFFCGATKRVFELRVEQKICHHYPAGFLLNKKIKDGSRDKRQYFRKLVHVVKQFPGDDAAALPPAEVAICWSSAPSPQYVSSSFSASPVLVFASHTPLYLQHHRLQV